QKRSRSSGENWEGVVQATLTLYGEAAATFMRSSQDGIPLSRLLKVSGIQRNTLTYKILLTAYEQPRFSTEVYQREAIANFRNGVELACYTGWKN
ncbi:hypothetical protein, partial [Pseudosulfitobacter sp. DSM 107133]|uniref:hypothetical protein n=1 Tax=Pseudosulfitobacter sp. DSM 107133 TaxID=2883100 RepID=UPI001966B089